ncbi:hypothetical protein IMZ31_19700 (plasmid) [Pontibacillus sp. ALD_SL1]|uniref:hypothetical protein n=1 Tax=Pontibacillus sp. ALD_SL1 TaxID=2777185 RepID=UPI001A97BECD|nr:hypothetical protein [Pontibacillus sp. ALD_SL1]QST02777.1 hypothetical protein IMZ31_19700 [Pontibacillus sp. ALD_SL1]
MTSLFEQLWNGKNAEELESLMETGFFKERNNWKPLGGTKENLSIVSAQTTNSVRAINEKVMNAVDALLERKCIEHGLDPKSQDAPTSLKEALKRFYNVDMNEDMDGTLLSQLAEDIQIIAEGDEGYPNLTVFDNGIGQPLNKFKETFLSLMAGNKSATKFTQGVFNMGSSAVLNFLEGGRYQIIASKSPFEAGTKAAWSIIRRHELTKEEAKNHRNTWFEYFTLNGNIPTFDTKDTVIPLKKGVFREGTLVKMFSYGLEKGLSGDVTKSLKTEMDALLFQAPLPVTLTETRFTKKKHRHERVVGNQAVIRQHMEDVELRLPFTLQVAPFGDVPVEVYVFQDTVPRKTYIGNRSVLFTLNGQTQGDLPRSFISQEIGYKMLRDSMLVHVNCSDLPYTEDIFSSSRGNVRESVHFIRLLDTLKKELAEDPTLQKLEKERRSKLGGKTDGTTKDLLRKVMGNIRMNKELTRALREAGLSLEMNGSSSPAQPSPLLKKQQAVTYLKEGDTFSKGMPLGGRTVLDIEVSDPLRITEDHGDVHVRLLEYRPSRSARFDADEKKEKGIPSPKAEDLFDIKKERKGSIARISLGAKEVLNTEDEILLGVELDRNNSTHLSLIEVKMTPPKKKSTPKRQPKLNLPDIIRVTRNPEHGDSTWKNYHWDERDIAKLVPGEGKGLSHIAINLDADTLQQKLHRNMSKEQVESLKNQFIMNVYTHSLFLYYQLLLEDESKEHETTVANMMKSHYGSFITNYNSSQFLA